MEALQGCTPAGDHQRLGAFDIHLDDIERVDPQPGDQGVERIDGDGLAGFRTAVRQQRIGLRVVAKRDVVQCRLAGMIGKRKLGHGDMRKIVERQIVAQLLRGLLPRLHRDHPPCGAGQAGGLQGVQPDIGADIDECVPRPHEHFQMAQFRFAPVAQHIAGHRRIAQCRGHLNPCPVAAQPEGRCAPDGDVERPDQTAQAHAEGVCLEAFMADQSFKAIQQGGGLDRFNYRQIRI